MTLLSKIGTGMLVTGTAIVIAISFALPVLFTGAVLYVAWHFIEKFW